MKKIVLLLVVICATVTANAQFYAGGSLGFWRNSTDNVNSAKLVPEVGYTLNDNWAIGVELGYAHLKSGDAKMNSYTIAPYARYSYFNKGIVSLFVDGGFSVNSSKIKDGDDETGFSIGCKPGVAIKLSDKFSLVSKFGFLGYADEFQLAGNTFSKKKEFGFDFSNNLTFGFFVNF